MWQHYAITERRVAAALYVTHLIMIAFFFGSPVAISSDNGYTDLLNGCMDHGWCAFICFCMSVCHFVT